MKWAKKSKAQIAGRKSKREGHFSFFKDIYIG